MQHDLVIAIFTDPNAADRAAAALEASAIPRGQIRLAHRPDAAEFWTWLADNRVTPAEVQKLRRDAAGGTALAVRLATVEKAGARAVLRRHHPLRIIDECSDFGGSEAELHMPEEDAAER